MLTRRASARSRPAHRCLSTLLDTGLSVTGSPLRRGERVRKGGPPLGGSLPGTRSLVRGRGHPTSQSRPGSPAPHHGLRLSDPRHRLKAFLYTSALRCIPLSDPSGGRGPDPRLDRDPSVSLGLPPALRDPADGGGHSRPRGPLHSWNEILVLCPLPPRGLKTGLKSSSAHTWILNSTFSVFLRPVHVLSAHPRASVGLSLKG